MRFTNHKFQELTSDYFIASNELYNQIKKFLIKGFA